MIFFIIGVPRSGTNFLSAILCNRADVFIDRIPHGAMLSRIMKVYQGQLKKKPGDPVNMLVKTFDRYKDDRLTQLFQPGTWDGQEPLSSKFTREIHRKREAESAAVWGDRTPRGMLNIPELNEIFPDARFIHIVRDGRSNALSLHQKGKANLCLSGQVWVDENIQGLAHSHIIGPSRYRIVRYEDILTDTENTIRGVCAFLGIDYKPDMLDISKSKVVQIENAYVQNEIKASRADEWQQQMNAQQIRQLEQIQSELLTFFGYPLLQVKPGTKAKSLSMRRQLWLRQQEAFGMLFRTRRMHMSRQQWTQKKIPIKARVKGFLSATAKNFLSPRILASFKSKVIR